MSDYGEPIGEVLGDGFRVPPLLPAWTALEGIVLVKCLDDEGSPSWAFRETEGMNIEETIGVLTIQLDMMRERASTLSGTTTDTSRHGPTGSARPDPAAGFRLAHSPVAPSIRSRRRSA
jgi:hypothetical protein